MASMSKRTQARNERELHELLHTPGNSQCADCGAKNPAWASWNLGIFLCMRCASIHRKLGTHISKVKSLSMDTWTADQVESMKQNGNIAVNKVYNPKNKKPDMPLDVDEVDSAMERFIRKKYQEKSLSDGKPEPPQRDDISPVTYSRPESQESPPPPLPPKKSRFFGFGLRASASAYSLSKHDKKKLPKEPRVDSAFHISADDYDSMSRMADARFEMTDAELQKKLKALQDMGFTDTSRNTTLLRRLGGDVERTIERLVQEGSRDKTTPSANRRSDQTTNAGLSRDSTATSAPAVRAPASSEPSYNPFVQMADQPPVGLSIAKPQPTVNSTAQTYHSNNPFDPPTRTQTQTGLEQSVQSLQLSRPLFPHSTGGYPSQSVPLQDPRLQYSATPPVPSTHFQQGYVASPAAISSNTNPFFQSSAALPQPTGNNPFLPQAAPASGPASPTMNPTFNYQSMQAGQSVLTQQRQSSLPTTLNPFGLPPAQGSPQPSQPAAGPQYQLQDPFGPVRQNPFEVQQANNPFQMQPQQPHGAQSLQSPQYPASGPGLPPGFQFTQPQTQQQPQLQPPPPQQQQQQTPQFQQQAPFQQQFNQQPQALVSQQTGRYDKNTILALYNYPQLAPKPLASIPEPTTETPGAPQPFSPYQATSPPPSGDVYGQPNTLSPARRSATMPASISNMHSAGGGGIGSRNPFFTNTVNTGTNFHIGAANPSSAAFLGGANAVSSPGPQPGGGARHHASAESVSISNLESGRHSPDAFASLSARSAR